MVSAYLSARTRGLLMWGAVAGICALGARAGLTSVTGAWARRRFVMRIGSTILVGEPALVAGDDITEFDQRLSSARARLSGVEIAGYVTTVPNGRMMNVGYALQTRRYFLA